MVFREEPNERKDNPAAQLASEIAHLKLHPKVTEALLWIARFIPGRHKFRVVIEDLGKFAKDELERTGV